MNSSSFNPLGPAHRISQEPGNEEIRHSMTRVGVFYATREGHTRLIAERIADDLRKLGFDVDTQDVRSPLTFKIDNYFAALIAASVHEGSHEPEMVKFVKDNRSTLENFPSALVSVTLSEAGVEKTDATPAQHAQYATDVAQMLDKFFAETQWHPSRVKPVAGALLYTHYNFILRYIMKRIAIKVGAGTDTSRDYDYTDWAALGKFVEQFATDIRSKAAIPEEARKSLRPAP